MEKEKLLTTLYFYGIGATAITTATGILIDEHWIFIIPMLLGFFAIYKTSSLFTRLVGGNNSE